MNDEFDSGDINNPKSYIRSIIDAIEVNDQAIRIVGSRDVPQAVIAGNQTANDNIRSSVRNWRAGRDSNP